MVADLFASRELAWQLFLRDIRAQYRQAALGIAWAFMLPAANAGVWLFMQSTGVLHVTGTGIPYPAFVISGTLLWAIFMDAANAPLQQMQLAKPMLAKINFPREALLLSAVLQTAFNGAIKLLILLAALQFFGVQPGVSLVLLPVVVFVLILLGAALGLALVPVGMLYTDIGRGLPLLMQFLMFLSPVAYAVPRSGMAATVLNLNPVTPLLVAARETLSGGWPPDPWLVAVIAAMAVFVLVLGWAAFRISMPVMIERMSA